MEESPKSLKPSKSKLPSTKDSPRSLKPSDPKRRGSVNIYATQCGKCFKWREIPTQEEYEDIRSKSVEQPFLCNHKPDVSCRDAADIEYDSTRIWVIDKPNIPKTPAGFKRGLVLRSDCSKMDTFYITPEGKKVRSTSEMAAAIQQNPKYKDVPISNFSFTTPKVMDDTIPKGIERKGSTKGGERKGSSSGNKRAKTDLGDDDQNFSVE